MKFYEVCNLESDASPKESAELIWKVLNYSKVVHVKGRYGDEAQLQDFYLNVASEIGDIAPMQEDLSTGDKTGDILTEIKYCPKIENSYRHSNSRQPLHTDGAYELKAPNLTFLFCIKQADLGGATVFIEAQVVFKILKEFDEPLLARLLNNQVTFSKGSDGKKEFIFSHDTSGVQVVWNYHRATHCDDLELIKDFHSFLDNRIVPSGLLKAVLLAPGEAVYFHDTRVLHGRNSFFGMRDIRKGGIACQISK